MASLIFEVPFAVNGDKEVIPALTQANGRVSFNLGFTADYEKDLLKDPDAKDVERKKLNYLFNVICNAINKLQKDGGGVIGVPIPYPSYNLPEGYVPYDGRQFDTGANPVLAVLFPGGALPDLRGLVIRGVDAGRGLDPSRELLSYQEDTTQRMTGRFVVDSNAWLFEGPFRHGGGAGKQSASGAGSASYASFDNARSVRTSNENRMKNMAFYYITKVG